MTIKEYNGGLLVNKPSSKFTNHGWHVANVRSVGNFFLKANHGSVKILGNDWEFEKDVIYASELGLIDTLNINQDLVTTIVGNYKGDKYSLEFAKHMRNRHERLRLLSVTPIIPETSSFGLLTGIATLVYCIAKVRTPRPK